MIASGQRNERWTTETAKMYKRTNQTNFFEEQAKLKMMLAQQDVFEAFFNGVYGNVNLLSVDGGNASNTYQAKTGWGVYPFMVYSGSQHATSSPTTVLADFKELAFNTNYKNVDEPRFILGTDRALSTLDYMLKDPVRYDPNDKIYDMQLDMYKIGKTMKFVPMVCPLFEYRSNIFPKFFEDMLLVLDLTTIDPVCEEDSEIFEEGNTSALYKKNGGYQDWIDYWVAWQVSMQMSNTDSSFYINLNGI
jgi:hypothetical protein